jgi:hypothetical protein
MSWEVKLLFVIHEFVRGDVGAYLEVIYVTFYKQDKGEIACLFSPYRIFCWFLNSSSTYVCNLEPISNIL